MPRKKTKPATNHAGNGTENHVPTPPTEDNPASPQGAPSSSATTEGAETTSAYFRRYFAERPNLLKERSNAEAFRRWLADHPGHTAVPKNVQAGLMNIKALLRKAKGVGKKQKPAAAAKATRPAPTQAPARPPVRALEGLEEQIDEVMHAARTLDREGLQGAIDLLRRARNEVVRRLMD
jgi:hypothetical protein